jgi:hypothetical protein
MQGDCHARSTATRDSQVMDDAARPRSWTTLTRGMKERRHWGVVATTGAVSPQAMLTRGHPRLGTVDRRPWHDEMLDGPDHANDAML